MLANSSYYAVLINIDIITMLIAGATALYEIGIKNSAYGTQQLSQPMWIVGPIQI